MENVSFHSANFPVYPTAHAHAHCKSWQLNQRYFNYATPSSGE